MNESLRVLKACRTAENTVTKLVVIKKLRCALTPCEQLYIKLQDCARSRDARAQVSAVKSRICGVNASRIIINTNMKHVRFRMTGV
jgi:hypothetical protein